MSQIDELKFQIAFGAVKHFGKRLYTSSPPAITELIANAWDAYATKCEVIFGENNSLLIIDNGIGMTDDEFQYRYAVSGFEKKIDSIRIPDTFDTRPYMGKKGIGKFSAFSLAEVYHLYTRSSEDEQWKKIILDYHELYTDKPTINVPIIRLNNLDEILDQFPGIKLPENQGTIICIPQLNRPPRETTRAALPKLIARRFSAAVLSHHNFSLYIDNIKIDLNSHFYYENVEFVYYFGYKIDEISKKFRNFLIDHSKEINDDFFTDHNIKGWISTVNIPANLKIENEFDGRGVVVYINGKLADEDILKFDANAYIGNSYLIGEVDADYLQNCDDNDPVLSSREGLHMEIKEVDELREHLIPIRNDLVTAWGELRAKRELSKQTYLTNIIGEEKYKTMFDMLNEEDQSLFIKHAQKLFDKPDLMTEKDVDIYFPALVQIVNKKRIDGISIAKTSELVEILKMFGDIFSKTGINDALRLADAFKERITVLDQLEKFIDDEEIELVFEKHLAKHPWLIDPSWESNSEIDTEVKFDYLNYNKQREKGRIDIIVQLDSNEIVVVEMKREKYTNYSAPDKFDIVKQIGVYKDAIAQREYADPMRSQTIKGIFICGQKSKEKLGNSGIDTLKSNNIAVTTYQDMIERAKKAYGKAAKIIKNA